MEHRDHGLRCPDQAGRDRDDRQPLDGDTGAVLRSGTGAGPISFPTTPLKKLTVTGVTGTPSAAEPETYAS
ncbi:hypothetical protein JCM9534A_04580 [Catenuloplanes indicus JCM 9534]